ncbi:MAG TPA: chromosome segregation protein SMC [Longilinea sp.]|nr:chromosome segregation protein SMC [Longilinea sp.]
MPPRLKSLELHGYKTFASRGLFAFPGAITAIVGPNGSGKSNIADSLRWVLGEQAFSLLRGRKTEDMIFSGSELRPKASMASATITFDNEDGWLPIDFNEVAITRRAYRDGDNEYLINNQRVRLKEINEMLAQSGLAERTYTVIGQGLVDEALSLRPEERRRFFEEAAGIGLYRSRREESLNRLETTRRNLERVDDIIAELTPRLQSLEKQAKRAIEYDRIKADLRLLLRDWYGYHWHKVQHEITHTREVVKGQEANLEKTKETLEHVEGHSENLRQKTASVRKMLDDWHEESARLHIELERKGKELAVFEERKRALLSQQQDLTLEKARLEEEEKAYQDQVTEIDETHKRLEIEFTEGQTTLKEAQEKLEARQIERNRVDQELRTIRQNLNAKETRKIQASSHLQEINDRLEAQQGQLANQQQALEASRKAVIAAQQALTIEQERVHSIEEDHKKAQERIQGFHAQIQENETEVKTLQQGAARLETEQAKIKAEIQVLDQAEASLSGFTSGTKSLLEAVKAGKLIGPSSLISQLFEIPQEYEAAIAAVLGDQIESVMISPKTELEQTLSFFDSGEHGRTVLAPIDLMRGEEIKSSVAEDCFGLASSLVKTDNAYRGLLQALLGNVIVVKDRKAARRMISSLPIHARVVTLRGEVFDGNGLIHTGKEGRSAVLSRPRQKRELQERFEQSDIELKEQHSAIQRIEQSLNGMRQKERDQQEEVRNLSRNLEQGRTSLQRASLEKEKAQQRLDWVTSQQDLLTKQIELGKRETQELTQQVSSLEEEWNQLQKDLRSRLSILNGIPLEEGQAEVAHWRTQVALAERAVRENETRLADRKLLYTSNLDKQKGISIRVTTIDEELATIGGQEKLSKEQEKNISTRIDELQQQIQPGEVQRADLDKENESNQLDLNAARQAVTVAERHTTQAQLELTRQKEQLETLRRRIEDDFGLVSYEYTPETSSQTPLPFEGMVEMLPDVPEIPTDLEDSINRQRSMLRRVGPVNPEAQKEYLEVKERLDFMSGQVEDLNKASADLRQVIAELDELMRREFRKTFDAVAIQFKDLFTRLFGGGSARLVLSDEENPTETGVDIVARLPGRREQGLSLLSGGERSLTAVALIFSLLKVSPTPFCILDEVDAMLDEANVGRFCELLLELSQRTQFIVITHNRNTVQNADVIYGITMGKDSASQVISLRMDELSEDMVK